VQPIALVTGANRGLGLCIADGLASRGFHVLLGCRDAGAAQTAVDRLQQRYPSARIESVSVDLARLSSIQSCAAELSMRIPRLDALVHNAAAILVPLGYTADGFETHLGTNALGPFALTGLLMPLLTAAPAARIVNMGSMAHRLTPGIGWDDLRYASRRYEPMEAYGASKLAALTFHYELSRRLQSQSAIAVAAHPGYSNTNPDKGGFFLRLMTKLIAQSADAGAHPALFAAVDDSVRNGEYFGPNGFKELRGGPRRVTARDEAQDTVLGKKFWSVAEDLTGVRYLD
jgi:NAD(P)-dependent dehydrogenase (short-subunit alcohol dehydrogenase family)